MPPTEIIGLFIASAAAGAINAVAGGGTLITFPVLLLFASILFMAQGAFRRLAGFSDKPESAMRRRHLVIAVLFQFAVAIYGGYFGAGIGILMLASLGFIGLTNIHEMNALKSILGSVINLIAAVWFIEAGLIHWPKVMVMSAGALGGYFWELIIPSGFPSGPQGISFPRSDLLFLGGLFTNNFASNRLPFDDSTK